MSRASLVIPIAVGAAFAALSTLTPVHDSDVFWHLATARDTLAGGIVRTDHFSWTVAGSSVSSDQWLGQVLLYLGYLAGSWRGIVAVRALAVGLLVTLIVASALSRRPSQPLLAVLVALPALLLSRAVSVERPELFGFVCFAALIPLLRALRDGRRGAAAGVVGLLILWANLHGSFAVGVVLVLLVAAEGAWRDSTRRSAYAVAAAGALVSLLATPAGLATLATPGLHFFQPPREIQEWTVPDPTTGPGLVWLLTLAAIVATALFASAAELHDVVVLLPIVFLSMTAARQMPLLPIVAAPYLAAKLPEAWRTLRSALDLDLPFPALGSRRAVGRRADAMAAALALVFVAAASVAAPAVPDETGFPTEALAALPPGPGLLNAYEWGGWLIWSAPRTPVFVDGRLVPYLGATLDDYRAVIGLHPDWREVLARRGIRTLLVRPDDAIAVRARSLGWQVVLTSSRSVLIAVPRP